MNLKSLAPLGLSAATAFVLVGVISLSSRAQAPGAPVSPTSPAPPAAAPPAAAPPAATAKPPGSPGVGGMKGMNVIDTSSPFDHDVHLNAQKMGKPLGCESCHDMATTDGTCPKQEVRFPKHEACAGCHAASFYTPPLTICTNCHTTTKFAKSNPMRELTRQVTPRKAEFNHKSHLQPGKSTDCTSCHAMQKGGDVVGHPSHPNCCECHSSKAAKPALPAMNKCGDCHNTAKNAGRPPSKIHSFSHKAHKEDPRTGSSTSCQQCHMNMADSTTLRGINIPPMATCVQCHDGSDPTKVNPNDPTGKLKGTGAFHFSSCLKCHISGSIGGMPLPPGHPTEAAPPGAIQ